MSDTKLLGAVLDGAQVPHQPLLVITETSTYPGLPLFRELIRRSEQTGHENVIVSVLHSFESLVPSGSSSRVVVLTGSVPGFGEPLSPKDLERRILDEYEAAGGRGSIFIDAMDVLAEDHSSSTALGLFRTLLNLIKDAKPPSRLVLLLPTHSTFLTSITPPTISPTITILTPHPPPLLTCLSQAYLTPIEASPKYWQILETATSRRLGDDLSFKGELGLDVQSSQTESIVQVLVRKATGGTKGMSRSLEAVIPGERGWTVKSVSEVIAIEPIQHAAPSSGPASGPQTNTNQSVPPKTHADLDLPFNLNLTDSQKAARMGVPLPYAHEGEGAAVDLEFDDEEDEDDEEI